MYLFSELSWSQHVDWHPYQVRRLAVGWVVQLLESPHLLLLLLYKAQSALLIKRLGVVGELRDGLWIRLVEWLGLKRRLYSLLQALFTVTLLQGLLLLLDGCCLVFNYSFFLLFLPLITLFCLLTPMLVAINLQLLLSHFWLLQVPFYLLYLLQ